MATYIKEKNNNGPLIALLAVVIIAALAIGAYFFFYEESSTVIEMPEPARTEVIEMEAPATRAPAINEPVGTND